MERVYVSGRKQVRERSLQPVLLVILALVFFVVISLFVREAYNGLREELIESLRKEREMTEINSRLKMELSVITRGRYVELKANERLGLKRPKEEEVLVLR